MNSETGASPVVKTGEAFLRLEFAKEIADLALCTGVPTLFVTRWVVVKSNGRLICSAV